jgi:hypothetical protein
MVHQDQHQVVILRVEVEEEVYQILEQLHQEDQVVVEMVL